MPSDVITSTISTMTVTVGLLGTTTTSRLLPKRWPCALQRGPGSASHLARVLLTTPPMTVSCSGSAGHQRAPPLDHVDLYGLYGRSRGAWTSAIVAGSMLRARPLAPCPMWTPKRVPTRDRVTERQNRRLVHLVAPAVAYWRASTVLPSALYPGGRSLAHSCGRKKERKNRRRSAYLFRTTT